MKAVALDNDWEAEWRATRKNASTGTIEPATGLAGLVARFSATDGGSAIHSSLSVNLTERGATGIYYGVLQGDDLRANLATYVEKQIFEVFGDGTNVLTSIPRRVTAVRRP